MYEDQIRLIQEITALFESIQTKVNHHKEDKDIEQFDLEDISRYGSHKLIWITLYQKLNHRLVGKTPLFFGKKEAIHVNEDAQKISDAITKKQNEIKEFKSKLILLKGAFQDYETDLKTASTLKQKVSTRPEGEQLERAAKKRLLKVLADTFQFSQNHILSSLREL